MEKAITLARVSTKEQEEEGYSVDAQTEFLEKYCISKNLEVIKKFKIAETASKPEMRREFTAILEYVIKNKINNIVVEKVDRLTRNSKSAVIVDDWLAENESRKLHLPKNSLILHKNSSSQDRFMWDIHIAVAKQYANNLREEVKKGVDEKLRQGWYPGSRPPVGYLHSGDRGQKTQIIDYDKSPLVILAFELYDTGNYSISSLCEELKNQGLTNVHGNKLSKSYLHELLRNKFYIGIMVWCGKEFKGNFKPLIDEDLFYRVQHRLSSKTSPQASEKRFLTLLKGKARCSVCNSTIGWYEKKGRWYGECKSQKGCPVRGTARQDRLEEEFQKYFEQLISPNPAIIAWVKKELKSTHYKEEELYNSKLSNLTNSYNRLDSQIKVLYEDRLDGRITPEIYDEKVKDKTKQKDEVSRLIGNLKNDNQKHISNGIRILDLTQEVASIFKEKSVEEQRILLSDIFSNITLNASHMEVEWRPETEIIRRAVKNTNNLENIFELQFYPSKKHLTREVRSTWLPIQVTELLQGSRDTK